MTDQGIYLSYIYILTFLRVPDVGVLSSLSRRVWTVKTYESGRTWTLRYHDIMVFLWYYSFDYDIRQTNSFIENRDIIVKLLSKYRHTYASDIIGMILTDIIGKLWTLISYMANDIIV